MCSRTHFPVTSLCANTFLLIIWVSIRWIFLIKWNATCCLLKMLCVILTQWIHPGSSSETNIGKLTFNPKFGWILYAQNRNCIEINIKILQPQHSDSFSSYVSQKCSLHTEKCTKFEQENKKIAMLIVYCSLIIILVWNFGCLCKLTEINAFTFGLMRACNPYVLKRSFVLYTVVSLEC